MCRAYAANASRSTATASHCAHTSSVSAPMKRGVALMPLLLPRLPCVLFVGAGAEVDMERQAESTARPVESQRADLSC